MQIIMMRLAVASWGSPGSGTSSMPRTKSAGVESTGKEAYGEFGMSVGDAISDGNVVAYKVV